MIELVDKDIKRIIVMEFHMFKRLEERLDVLIRGIEDIKGCKSNLDVKTIMSEMKHILDGINGMLDIAEEKISKLEYMEIKTI